MLNRLFTFQKCLSLVLLVTVTLLPEFAAAQEPRIDTRHKNLIDADHFELRIKPMDSQAEWEARKKEIRETLLLRAGLWLMPEKNPLNARIFDERRGDGFTVSKVYFESFPGFLATGNLYRPTKGTPPYPAVITPHGHWQYGRLQNGEAGSIPGRCIDFARMGFVVFSIDMIGYNDSFQLPHDPGKSVAQLKADEPQPYEHRAMRADFDFPEMELYGFNLGGMQLLNGIRSIDFLSELPDVDPGRIGVTGASGGATQTIFLMIADDRIKVASPVNIIGAEKHPGCRCENIPGLWLDTSTVEMSAAFSPRPLLLMSATKDPWTPKTPEREFPMIQKYYALDNAKDMVGNVHIDAGHNYNADTRAAVYEWFCKHLNSQFPPIKNPVPVSQELKKLGDLRVFPDRILPEGALSGWQIMRNWKAMSEEMYSDRLPGSEQQYNKGYSAFQKDLQHVLSVKMTLKMGFNQYFPEVRSENIKSREGMSVTKYTRFIKPVWTDDRIEFEMIHTDDTSAGSIILIYPDAWGGFQNPQDETLKLWAENLLKQHYQVYRIRGYASGQLSIPEKTLDSFSWSNAYNRDNRLNGIHDIHNITVFIRSTNPEKPVTVVGLGDCGIPAAFACATSGSADNVIIDMNGSDPGYDGELTELMPYNAIKRIGDFRTAVLLLMRGGLVLCNPGPTFDKHWYMKQVEKLGYKYNNLEFRPDVSLDTLDELFE